MKQGAGADIRSVHGGRSPAPSGLKSPGPSDEAEFSDWRTVLARLGNPVGVTTQARRGPLCDRRTEAKWAVATKTSQKAGQVFVEPAETMLYSRQAERRGRGLTPACPREARTEPWPTGLRKADVVKTATGGA